jgi:oligopeptide transport system substrate-binding protein
MDFRLALNYAVDREDYIAITSSGIYSPAGRFVFPQVKGISGNYVDEYPIEEFPVTADLEAAQQHLQAAMDAMGISDPSEISIELKISDTEASKLIVENLQDQLATNLGINVTTKIVTYSAMLAERVSGEFDLIYAGWMPDYDDPYTYLSYFVSTNSQNGGKYKNARYDELVNTANSYPDADTRLSMYAEAEELLISEGGIIPLQVREVPAAVANNLKGYLNYYLGMTFDYTYAYFE